VRDADIVDGFFSPPRPVSATINCGLTRTF